MRVVCVDDTWPLDRANAILASAGAEVVFASEIAGDDVGAVLTYPGRPVEASVLEQAPNLRAVATCSTGFDHLDVDGLAAHGVWCCRVTHFCDDEVADHTIGLAIACLRGIVALDRLVRDGVWWPYPQPPRPVTGAVLGVIGFGSIGRGVIRRGAALGMEVLVASEHASVDEVAAAGGRLVPIDELLASSDVVSLMTSVTERTRGMIDAAALATMRRDAYLVNTARAALIDHDALGAALRDGVIAGAALDALPVEPAPPDAPERDWPHTILQPHAAWYSAEADRRSFDDAAEDVARILRGERPLSFLRDVG
ncbi:MAG: C-terminal binding protein [Gaiellales bacterium]